MVEAMGAVKSGRLGVNRATEKYIVSRILLKDRLAGRIKHGSKSGPDPYLTSSEEGVSVKFSVNVCNMSHGKIKREVIDIVKWTVKKKEEDKDFKFNEEGWWQEFMQRHSSLFFLRALM